MKFSEFYLCINNFCAVLKDAKSVSWTLLLIADRKASSYPLGSCYATHDRGWPQAYVVPGPPFFHRHSRASETRARVKTTPREKRRDFHARSRFAHSTIPEEKWGTTRSLRLKINRKKYLYKFPAQKHVSFRKYSNLNFRVFTVRDTKIGMLSMSHWKKSLLLIFSSLAISSIKRCVYLHAYELSSEKEELL